MKRIGTTLAALGLCVAAAACENPQQKIAGKEDMMTAAGFKFVPANTPARQASFKQLPAHRFSRQIRDGQRLAGYDHRTVAVAHAAATRQQGVLVEQVRVGVEADGRNLQFAAQRPAVERFNVLQFVTELKVAGVELVVGEGVEHEGVVGVGTVTDRDELFRHGSLY